MGLDITHLLAADDRTAPSTPRVPVTIVNSGGTTFLGPATATQPVSFVATFSENLLGNPATDHILSDPAAGGEFKIPTGWNAYIYAMTMGVSGTIGDVETITADLYVDGQDQSEEFDPLLIDLTEDDSAAAFPLSSPYLIAGSAAGLNGFNVKVTTDGTTDTMNVVVQVVGIMFPAF